MPDSWRDALAVFDNLALRPGCSDAAIAAAASELDTEFPGPLVEFLRETNGVYDRAGQYEYGWSLARIVSENADAWGRSDEALPRAYLAFGSDGAGDWFCLRAGRGSEVFHWAWIDFDARQIASDLRAFWTGWFSGELTV